MKTKLFIGAGIIALLFAGCKGDTGAVGPQGPAGAANITTGQITANPNDWSEYNNNPDISYVNYNDAAITSADDDVVMAYVQGASGWYGLPQTNYLTPGDELAFSYADGTVTFFYDFGAPPTVSLTFKIAVIPPSVAKKYVGTNWNDYNAVNAILQTEKGTK